MLKRHSEPYCNYITINTNKNCLLKCTYCYENKPANIQDDILFWEKTKYHNRIYNNINNDSCTKPIDINFCKKFIDYILNYDFKDTNKLVFDFIGGDSLQYPKLLHELFSYITEKAYNTKYKYTWVFHISSNGVTLLDREVQNFCERWRENLDLGISIDGCPELHDLHRKTFSVYKNGYDGSFKYIQEVWPWYRKNFPAPSLSTKFTLTPQSYKYLFKSIKFLYEELGISYIFFNRVMEQNIIDTSKDLEILNNEFENVNEYLTINHMNLYLFSYDFSRVSESKNYDYTLKNNKEWSRCGFGRMPSLNTDGKIYPCFRMIPGFCSNGLNNDFSIGDINEKNIDINNEKNKLLLKNSFAVNMTIKEKCKKCLLFSSCPHCAADCVSNDLKLIKTDSVCGYHIIETLNIIKYWKNIREKYNKIYNEYNVYDFFKQEDINSIINTLKII